MEVLRSPFNVILRSALLDIRHAILPLHACLLRDLHCNLSHGLCLLSRRPSMLRVRKVPAHLPWRVHRYERSDYRVGCLDLCEDIRAAIGDPVADRVATPSYVAP